MVRTNVTITLDSEVKKEAMEILKKIFGDNKFSFYIELCLKKLIKKYKEEKINGFRKKEKERKV